MMADRPDPPQRVREKLEAVFMKACEDIGYITVDEAMSLMKKVSEEGFMPSFVMAFLHATCAYYEEYYRVDVTREAVKLIDEMWRVVCDETRLHMV